jgi:hypothetical protein
MNRTEAKGHQCCLSLAQKVCDFMRLTCPSCLKLLQPFVSISHLLKLPLHLPLLPVELGLVGGKDHELTLLQLLLPVRHYPLSLGYGDLLCVGIRLLLDGGNGAGLSYGV